LAYLKTWLSLAYLKTCIAFLYPKRNLLLLIFTEDPYVSAASLLAADPPFYPGNPALD
jgi:hypothetical protein